jgi:hypothetical protein
MNKKIEDTINKKSTSNKTDSSTTANSKSATLNANDNQKSNQTPAKATMPQDSLITE